MLRAVRGKPSGFEEGNLEQQAFVQALATDSLRRYRNLADAIPHIVLRTTAGGLLEYHNALWPAYTGMNDAESAGAGWQKAIEPADRAVILRAWKAGTDGSARAYESEIRLRRHDGTYRWQWLKGVPERGGDGRVMAWLVTCTDVHDRIMAVQEYQEAQRVAEAASQAKSLFLANMSHEIRTPLNAIMGFTELLMEPDTSIDEIWRKLAIIRRNGQQLLKIVNEVLDLSKIEGGGVELERREIDLNELLADVQTGLDVVAQKKGVELDFVASTRLPERIWTDSARLRQILFNIVGNAIKFTEQGAVLVTTGLQPAPEGGGQLSVTVTDSGLGIEASAREKIFEPFTQADSSSTRRFGGAGLGLALARRLARALGGDVRLLDSRPGRGSTFQITIRVGVGAGFNAPRTSTRLRPDSASVSGACAVPIA